MKYFLCLFLSGRLMAASCCDGSAPKTFESLQNLQTFDFNLSLSQRTSYGEHDVYGELVSTQPASRSLMNIGAAARVTPQVETFTAIPLVREFREYSGRDSDRSGLGDISLGVRYEIIQSLLPSDEFPTVALIGGVKAPTGTIPEVVGGQLLPGTGNGSWEPFVGVGLNKDFEYFKANIGSVYSYRSSHEIVNNGTSMSEKLGDRIDVTESVSYAIERDLNISLGSTQSWELAKQFDGVTLPDSHKRTVSAFVGVNYWVSNTWSLGATFEATVPIESLSVNAAANRQVMLSTRYGIY